MKRGIVGSLAAAFALLACLLAPVAAQLKSGDDPEASEVWKKVRARLF